LKFDIPYRQQCRKHGFCTVSTTTTSIEEHIIVQEKNLLLLLLLHQIDFVLSLSLPNNKWKPSPSLATNSYSLEPPLVSGTLSLHRLNLLRAAPSKSHTGESPL
jgi:hypothetical protein